MIDCKTYVDTLDGKPVAVFGLGLSGLSTVEALCAAGATVMAWDDRAETHEPAKQAGAKVQPLDEKSLKGCAALVLAPGVPLNFPKPHPVVLAARENDVEIIGDLEILHRCNHGRKTVGITGTNGKSTTTALLGHILAEAGCSVSVGGNIGTPALAMDMPDEGGFFVFEISSYQMDLCPGFRPDVSILLNITPDHLERHGNFKNYIAAKARIFEGEGTAVISLDDEPCRRVFERLVSYELGKRKVISISCEGEVEQGVYASQGTLFDAIDGQAFGVGSLSGILSLRGSHNHQNVAAAYAVCRELEPNLKASTLLDATKSFPGLPHRQFQVRVINGIPYINDSKATNAEAASKALTAYRNIYWIAGGRPKGDGLDDLHEFIPGVRHAFLIGEASTAFAGWLDQYSIPYTLCGELQNAVHQAHTLAQEERGRPGGAGVVLLSPACASFDQFKSFEERGDKFTEFVSALKGEGDSQEEAA